MTKSLQPDYETPAPSSYSIPPMTASFKNTNANSVVPQNKTRTRKPYTITKQREIWSDHEHSRFLQALHLYGRDWRKIEAHVVTKTVIQIRSHAQKYFLKLQKDASLKNSYSNSSKSSLRNNVSDCINNSSQEKTFHESKFSYQHPQEFSLPTSSSPSPSSATSPSSFSFQSNLASADSGFPTNYSLPVLSGPSQHFQHPKLLSKPDTENFNSRVPLLEVYLNNFKKNQEKESPQSSSPFPEIKPHSLIEKTQDEKGFILPPLSQLMADIPLQNPVSKQPRPFSSNGCDKRTSYEVFKNQSSPTTSKSSVSHILC